MNRYLLVGFVTMHIIIVNIFAHNSFVKQHTLKHGEIFTHHHEHHHHHIHENLEHQHGHSHTIVFTDFYNTGSLYYDVMLFEKNVYFMIKDESSEVIPQELLRPPIV